jgi:hypothetical protein
MATPVSESTDLGELPLAEVFATHTTPPMETSMYSTKQIHPGNMPWFSTLRAVVGDNRITAISLGADGQKRIRPVALGADIDACINAHATGHPITVKCVAKGSEFLVHNVSVFGVYLIAMIEGKPVVRQMVIDIDVAGANGSHAGGMTPADAMQAKAKMVAVLTEAGFTVFVERSHGGAGWHIWTLFPEPVSAAFAKAFGEMTKAEAGYEACTAIEIFPKQAEIRHGGLGSSMTLPAPGRPRVAGGGVLYRADGSLALPSDIAPSPLSAVTPLVELYAQAQATIAGMAEKEKTVKAYRDVLFKRKHGPDLNVPIDLVARSMGVVVDDGVTESDILVLTCPRHGGSSLHVHISLEPGEGWWKCHACGIGGGGITAPETLAAWLNPRSSRSEIRTILADLAGKGGAQ